MSDSSESRPLAGYRVESLIAAPLQGAARASLSLADATVEYINKVGAKKLDFSYDRPRRASEGGEIVKDKVDVSVPLLAIAPAPNLQVDSMDVEFSLEVKSVEKRAQKDDSLAGDGLAIYGHLTAPKEQARDADNFSKYHIKLHASNQGVTEALARVFDLMASAVAPSGVTPTKSAEDSKADKPAEKEEEKDGWF